MANVKISALTSATTPLAGTEVLPIVQSSTTVKVATNDLTVKNVRANATTGILQVTGPTAGTTRIMTTPDANFTAARTDAAQTFTGTQTVVAAATQDGVALAGRAAGTGSYVATITPAVLSAARTVTLPDANTTLPIASYAYTFTGPTAARTITLPNSNTSIPAASYIYTLTGPTAARTITLPDADFSVARIDAAQSFTGNQTLATGNLIIGTAGKGIDFSVNSHATGMTSELLTWYEEGTWTPVVADAVSGGNVASVAAAAGRYTRVGRVVTVQLELTDITTTGMTAGNQVFVRGLPFTPSATFDVPGSCYTNRCSYAASGWRSVVAPSSAIMQFVDPTNANANATYMIVSNILATTSDIYATLTYTV